jgi:hypothetical protein
MEVSIEFYGINIHTLSCHFIKLKTKTSQISTMGQAISQHPAKKISSICAKLTDKNTIKLVVVRLQCKD